MRGNDEVLEHVLAALATLGGYFTFHDTNGEEVIIVRKKDLATLSPTSPQAEVQLSLAEIEPPKPSVQSADELLEQINRDIALYRDQLSAEIDEQDLEAVLVPEEESAPTPDGARLPPPRRVRFEPLRGDLPPELQE